ncbi:hypothetical protein BO71DRAFT_397803 [Aspergillus ellipticus CBS 707.79]|uniref:Uncharacterized protein n=1 Tax=Aspergillus ellipticus CBS 707.79 TaxID=1448320 RepID=A0A319DNR0_9EURO|nr:hypothetical protein BO71DRAFT_397803 [Aspergillus ellipticus CBS 707.79]
MQWWLPGGLVRRKFSPAAAIIGFRPVNCWGDDDASGSDGDGGASPVAPCPWPFNTARLLRLRGPGEGVDSEVDPKLEDQDLRASDFGIWTNRVVPNADAQLNLGQSTRASPRGKRGALEGWR